MNLSHNIYQAITILLSPFLKALVLWRSVKGKEDKARLGERWGISSVEKRPSGPLYWIHAVSVGEANSALILVKLLKELAPQAHILMTTGTLTSANLMVKKLPVGVIHQYLPLDTPLVVRSFLDFWEPNIALWIESEIWPNLLIEMRRRRIPLLLLNGRMSRRSFLRWQKIPFFVKPLMEAFAWCGVQTIQDLRSFSELGAVSVEVMPNLKLLTDEPTYSSHELESLKESLRDRPVWFASCTHPGEEEGLLEAHKLFLKSEPRALLFLAPRHIVRIKSIKSVVEKLGFSYGLRTSGKDPDNESQVYLIDSMGELGLFYRLSPITFVGGTWLPKGGHNPVEAAQTGSYVLHGGSIKSNQVLYELLAGMGLSEQVDDPEALCEKLLNGAPRARQSWGHLRKSGLEDVKSLLAKYVREKEEQAC